MMTKQDYWLLVKVIASNKREFKSERARERFVESLADELHIDNHRFDPVKFTDEAMDYLKNGRGL